MSSHFAVSTLECWVMLWTHFITVVVTWRKVLIIVQGTWHARWLCKSVTLSLMKTTGWLSRVYPSSTCVVSWKADHLAPVACNATVLCCKADSMTHVAISVAGTWGHYLSRQLSFKKRSMSVWEHLNLHDINQLIRCSSCGFGCRSPTSLCRIVS